MKTASGFFKSMAIVLSAVAAAGLAGVAFSQPTPAQSQPASANSQKLPDAAEVLERYVNATGGREALLRYKSMTVHGRYEIPAKKLVIPTVFYAKENKGLWKFLLPGGKEQISGYDGKIGWDIDPSGKASLRKGDGVRSMARDADMYYHLHVMNYFRSMEVVGVKEFNGRPCYHLKGVNNWGQVNEQFYDKKTGLLQGYAFNTAWRGGTGEATMTFADYKDFGGVLMPTRITSCEGGDLTISVVTSVSYDDVDDAVFALPEMAKKAGS
jgi:zinc protease